MADSAVATDAAAVECGFCMQKGEVLVNPKTLPCIHVHCLRCLTDYYDRYSMLECPFCSKVYEIKPDSLPAANIKEDNSPLCDVCLKKGVNNEEAVVYCKMCTKKYCLKHQEVHDDLFNKDHPMITINDYRVQERKLQIRNCTEHKDQVYIMGCKVCLGAFCVQCLSGDGVNTCTNGMTHQLLTLDELVMKLSKEIDQVKGSLADKEDKLAGIFKLISKVVSDHDAATEEMIQALHRTRDEQLSAIRLKYDLLEAELIEKREKTKTEITEFMEEDVGKQLFRLSNHRLRIEAQLQYSHQVDVINRFREAKHELESLVNEDESTLQLKTMMKLRNKAEHRDTELELIPDYNQVIDLKHGLITSKPLKSLTRLGSTQLASCVSVCHHHGVTYAGCDSGTVTKIEENYQLGTTFATTSGQIESLTWYKSRMYALVNGNPFKVEVYDDSGKKINQWNHTDTKQRCNKLTLVGDRMVIPDRSNKRLTVYSLTGKVVKYIPCSLSDHDVAVCTAGRDSVIVSDYNSSQVCRVNITNNEIVWTSTAVREPQGVTCYGGNQVCVYSSIKKKLAILNSQTGELIREFADKLLTRAAHIYDLHIFGDILVVPGYSNSKVMFFKLE